MNDTLWKSWEKKFPLLAQLEECPQEPEFHSEGNVKIHTQMVFDAAVELAKEHKLSTEETSDLEFCALFHDIAKPITLQIDEAGKASSPKHARKGAEVLRFHLWKTPGEKPFSLQKREMLLQAIALHAWPIRAFERTNPKDSAIQASLLTQNQLLGLLAAADMSGRICQDPNVRTKGIEDALLFLELAKENNCLKSAFPFHNEHSKIHYLKGEETSPAQMFEDPKAPIITVLCGLPASGKDYWLSKNYSHKVISRDEIRKNLGFPNEGQVLQELLSQIKENLRKKEPFAINATNLRRELRSGYANLIHSYGAKSHMVYLEAPEETLRKRIKEREKSLPEKEHIPWDAITRMASKMEPPTTLECHSLEFIELPPRTQSKIKKHKELEIEP